MNLENIMDPFAGEPVDDLLILSGNGLYDIVRDYPWCHLCHRLPCTVLRCHHSPRHCVHSHAALL